MKGLVMEGGAMRGMFTAGVIDVFMENGIEFDAAVGVSAGATFGCNFKSRQIGRAIRYNKKFCRDWRYCSVRSLVLTGDLYGADFCYNRIPNELDVYDLESYRKNPMKFYVVASDCETGTPIYRELKDCGETDLEWMRGSASMPLASRIVNVDGFKILDGGMTDSIPLEFMEAIGCTKNVVILTQHREYAKTKSKLMWLLKIVLARYPRLVEAMEHRAEMYNSQKEHVFRRVTEGSAIAICPEKPLGIRRTEKNPDELQRCYDEGRRIATERLSEIRAFLSD